MKVFVANCSEYNQVLQWRPPEHQSVAARSQLVGLRDQVQLSGEFTQQDVDALVEQQQRYGFYNAANVGQVRGRVTFVYSVGARIRDSVMASVIERNRAITEHEARKNRAEAAAGVSQSMENYNPSKHHGTEVTIVEDRKDDTAPIIDEHLVFSTGNRAGFVDRATRGVGAEAVVAPKKRRRSSFGLQ